METRPSVWWADPAFCVQLSSLLLGVRRCVSHSAASQDRVAQLEVTLTRPPSPHPHPIALVSLAEQRRGLTLCFICRSSCFPSLWTIESCL